MSENPIPVEVGQFIIENIDSIAQLEAILLLRNNPDDHWSVQSVAKRLYISEQETAPLLARLQTMGIITASRDRLPHYRYQPNSQELATILDRLAQTYSSHLVPVTNLVHSKPKTRIKEFADAFKLRKEE
jgi:hypothetical protein